MESCQPIKRLKDKKKKKTTETSLYRVTTLGTEPQRINGNYNNFPHKTYFN
jgi:hypothetical protein